MSNQGRLTPALTTTDYMPPYRFPKATEDRLLATMKGALRTKPRRAERVDLNEPMLEAILPLKVAEVAPKDWSGARVALRPGECRLLRVGDGKWHFSTDPPYVSGHPLAALTGVERARRHAVCNPDLVASVGLRSVPRKVLSQPLRPLAMLHARLGMVLGDTA